MRQRQDIAEQFSTDEMAQTFIKAYSEKIFGTGEILVFDFHGQNLKAKVVGLSVVELTNGTANQSMGILMNKTDVTFIKANDSLIKLKTSSKK